LWIVFLLIWIPLPSPEESFDDQFKSIPELFPPCQVSERLLVIHRIGHLWNFTAVPKYCIPFKTWRIRGRTVTISLFYMLKSFSSCFTCLEKKILTLYSLLQHYKLSCTES
jgi:hypothetical protein